MCHIFDGVEGSKLRKEKAMWQLDDTTKYVRLGDFDYPKAMTNSINQDDPDTISERREYIRKQAATKISQTRVNEVKPQVKWWAFRIFIQKKLVGKQRFDLDNAAKLVADTFDEGEVRKDRSLYGYLALYEDDKLPFVRVVVVTGEPSGSNHTNVEIFGSLVS